MPQHFEADVLLLHIAAGAARSTPPPGNLAQTAPRRAARGRGDDLIFITLDLRSTSTLSPGHADQLARLAIEAFFGTPGSVTAALREAAVAVNDRLVSGNQNLGTGEQVEGHLGIGVLRVNDLYVAQCGTGQALVIRPGQIGRLGSEEAARRPLGGTVAPFVRYHHIQVAPGDLILLTASPPPLWSDPTLAAVAGMDPARALDSLVPATPHDVTGVMMRMVPRGEAAPLPRMPARPMLAESDASIEAAGSRRRPAAGGAQAAGRFSSVVGGAAAAVWGRLEPPLTAAGEALMRLVSRLAPGLAEPAKVGSFTPGVLVGTAIAVPLVIVALASVVYLRRGRTEQFQSNLTQAQAAVVAAQFKPSGEDSRPDWERALYWLDQAAKYGSSGDADSLRKQVNEALDRINLIIRLDFQPAVSGGFGAQAHIARVAASATDIYAYDDAEQVIWHAWATGRGYEIDQEFECLGSGSGPSLGKIVDIVVQPPPGALGSEGVVAVDEAGRLLYCAPGTHPAFGTLATPDIGWGRIQAVDELNDRLYVLDPVGNAIWVYDASDGLFSGEPSFYFAEAVPRLKDAIDLAVTQDEMLILYQDGRLDRCRRSVENTLAGTSKISVECDSDQRFTDDRPGFEPSATLPGAPPLSMVYSPPPEPSLFFLVGQDNTIFHYSMRLVYQGQYKPSSPFDSPISALTVGPPKDLYIGVGSQVYYAQPVR
jgi:hypothetical protein